MSASVKSTPIHRLYKTLFQIYGKQSWWPADTPFEVMVGAILTQNTAWSNVEKAIANIKQKGMLQAQALVEMPQEMLADMIRPSGYFNVKAKRIQAFCQWYVRRGSFEDISKIDTEHLRNELLSIHGIGRETADDILLYAFQRPVFVIDAYARRLFTRTGSAVGERKYDDLRCHVEEALNYNVNDLNEFHALIVKHVKDCCKVKPLCNNCSLGHICSYGGKGDGSDGHV